MLYFALSHYDRVYRSPGNYNNHIGLPLSLLNMPKITRIGIFELGTNHPSEIAFLTKILNPDLSLITNIGFGHMEFFDSLESVYYEKTDLFKFMKTNGVIFKNMNDQLLKDYFDSHRLVTYGVNSEKVEFNTIYKNGHAKYKGFDLKLEIENEYNIINATAVIAITSYLGYYDKAIVEILRGFKPVSGRMDESVVDNFTIINDAYNANPNSMLAALDTLNSRLTDDYSIAILGDMLELGSYSESKHQEILKEFEKSEINQIYTYGDNFKKSKHKRSKHFDTKSQIVDELNKLNVDTLIMLKGSRGMSLEDISKELIKRRSVNAG